ncbi:hypothetical protein H257_08003 [Aphanomyces astaci]|uniref:Uncharacterized protein n=1 Tax=Aphanomyces astaci TaxID=112090 RepID=W4GFM7_APHAT|nr:hypothetical protein H257_08003 [Aphanomyces astaci]ETV78480.1 hypothetical protein H257_08003 [Aphanomyces astaci]|eukprot:XP_009832061.1 hypothetical protein H257_08003 [Aphanomyces astaci]
MVHVICTKYFEKEIVSNCTGLDRLAADYRRKCFALIFDSMTPDDCDRPLSLAVDTFARQQFGSTVETVVSPAIFGGIEATKCDRALAVDDALQLSPPRLSTKLQVQSAVDTGSTWNAPAYLLCDPKLEWFFRRIHGF